MRIGVLGGTFDPIHRGHIAAGRVAASCADLDLVLFIPSALPPHRGPAVAEANQRLAMTRLAVAGEKGFEASDVEIRRGGPSLTADTIVELHRIHPHDELFLILGWDAARLFSTWHRPNEIRDLASFVVVSRPGTPSPGESELTEAGLDPSRVILCIRPTPDISGSELRDAIARGDSVSDRVPLSVERYIAQHGLYRDNREVGC